MARVGQWHGVDLQLVVALGGQVHNEGDLLVKAGDIQAIVVVYKRKKTGDNFKVIVLTIKKYCLLSNIKTLS